MSTLNWNSVENGITLTGKEHDKTSATPLILVHEMSKTHPATIIHDSPQCELLVLFSATNQQNKTCCWATKELTQTERSWRREKHGSNCSECGKVCEKKICPEWKSGEKWTWCGVSIRLLGWMHLPTRHRIMCFVAFISSYLFAILFILYFVYAKSFRHEDSVTHARKQKQPSQHNTTQHCALNLKWHCAADTFVLLRERIFVFDIFAVVVVVGRHECRHCCTHIPLNSVKSFSFFASFRFVLFFVVVLSLLMNIFQSNCTYFERAQDILICRR